MPLFAVLHLRVFWNSLLGNPFLDVVFPVTSDSRLVDIIRAEVLRHDPSRSSIDFVEDIKSAKTPSGMDASRILELPVSTFFDIVSGKNPKNLTVVIDKPTPPSSLPAAAPFSMFQTIMANSRPKHKVFTSKFNLESVKKFQLGYCDASNKEQYLAQYSGGKPNIHEQIEAFIVDFLNEQKLKIKGGTRGGERNKPRMLCQG